MSSSRSSIAGHSSLRQAASRCFLGVDCGTQGTKALVIDRTGKRLGRGYAAHELLERPTGAREQQPAWWIDAMKKAVRQALTTVPEASTVAAMSVSGQQHGLVVLDEHLQVIRPAKLWNDTETSASNAELVRRMGGRKASYDCIGIVPLTGYTASKLLWLADHEPENFARIRHILLPHDYLNFWLTGQLFAEAGDASGTAFFDVRKRAWSREVLDQVDGGTQQLFNALPPLSGDQQIVGCLRSEIASELGLPPDCVVSAGGGDNMMAAIGTGNVREGVVTLSLGTSATVYSYSSQPSQDATGSVASFCSSSGGWLPLVCTMNVTTVVTGMVTLLGKTLDYIDAALDTTPPGADGLIFLPFLNGERTPDLPTARGSLHGISPMNFTPSHLTRAAVEGVSFGILAGLDLVLAGRKAEVVQVIGGGSRSRAWRQLLADASGAVIQVPRDEEAGCLGAAMQAIVAFQAQTSDPVDYVTLAEELVRIDEAATCTPNPALRPAYDQARRAYTQQLFRSYPEIIPAPLSAAEHASPQSETDL